MLACKGSGSSGGGGGEFSQQHTSAGCPYVSDIGILAGAPDEQHAHCWGARTIASAFCDS